MTFSLNTAGLFHIAFTYKIEGRGTHSSHERQRRTICIIYYWTHVNEKITSRCPFDAYCGWIGNKNSIRIFVRHSKWQLVCVWSSEEYICFVVILKYQSILLYFMFTSHGALNNRIDDFSIWVTIALITVTSWLAWCCLKSPASRVFAQPFFRRRWKKTSKHRVTGLCEGNHRWPVDSPHTKGKP